ncbi:MAG: imidazole glycerol phosphate synthase subunit HisH [Clostridia bacterium]|nr:imidazole glycerol phosphate synthase subunit HisH [Clostridia bacterium]
MTSIIDYGVGNLFSLKRSLEKIGEPASVTGSAEELLSADRVILPGVGAFGDAAAKLRETGLDRVVKEAVAAEKPVLGICLGMQLLFDESLEFGVHKGLGLLRGRVLPFGPMLKKKLDVPHMGWNSLRYTRPSELFEGVPEGSFVYFVHSFAAFDCSDSLIAETDYSVTLTAAVQKGRLFATQFHPEKSGDVGLRILKNFCEQ